MCLAPSQHYSREGLLTQSGLAQRAEQVESSENRPQKKKEKEKELPSQAQVLLQLELCIMLPLFTTQSDISNNQPIFFYLLYLLLQSRLFLFWTLNFYYDRSKMNKPGDTCADF